MVGSKQKGIPSLQSLTMSNEERRASLFGHIPKVVTNEELYMLEDISGSKTTLAVSTPVMDTLEGILAEMRDHARGSKADRPTFTDLLHASFLAFLQGWNGEDREKAQMFREFMTEWVIKRRHMIKVAQYGERGEKGEE